MSSFQRIGSDQRVNQFTTGTQSTGPRVFSELFLPRKAVAIDEDGDIVVAWSSDEQEDNSDIDFAAVVRRYTRSGDTLTTSGGDQIVNTTVTEQQFAPAIAVDSDGDFVVAWVSNDQDGDRYGIYTRQFNRDGTPASAEMLVNTYTTARQLSPTIARISAKDAGGQEIPGRYVISWTSAGQDGSNNGVFFQEFNADGSKRGIERGIAATVGQQVDSVVAINAQGDFVIAWENTTNPGSGDVDIYAQIFRSDGTQSEAIVINARTPGAQTSPTVAIDKAGNFIVAWASAGATTPNQGVYARRFRRDGTAIDAQDVTIRLDTGASLVDPNPSIAVNPTKGDFVTDPTGDLVITWSELQGNDRDIYAKRYGMNDLNAPIDDTFLVNVDNRTGTQLFPSVAINSKSDFVISWSREGDGTLDVFSQAFRVPDNPPPVVTTTAAGDILYTENAGPVAIDPGVTLTDNSGSLRSVVIQVANYRPSEDFLLAPASLPPSLAAPVFDAAAGTLTITASGATAPVGDFQQVVRAVTYRSGENPDGTRRAITITATDATGSSGSGSRNLSVTPVNDAPSIIISNGATPVLVDENATAVIATDILLSDPDNAQFTSAIVEIVSFSATTNQGDRLIYTPINGINGTFDSATGRLALTGTATLADYQAALQSIQFQTNGLGGDRTIRFTVNDGQSANNTAAADRLVRVGAIDDPPEVRFTDATPLTYTEGGAPLSLGGPAIVVTDEEDDPLTSVVITIDNLNANDNIGFVIPAGSGITSALDRTARTLSFNGSALPAVYQELLRSITFSNLNENPGAATRVFSIVARAGSNSSPAPAVRTINVINVAGPPSLSPATGDISANERTDTDIANQIALFDSDSENLKAAVIQFTNNSFVAGQDELRFTNQSGITGSFNAATGELQLTGNASPENYQAALRSITYFNSSRTPNTTTPRSISIRVTDDSDLTSNLATRTITVLDTTDPPEIAPGTDTVTYVENAAPAIVAPNLTAVDQDSTDWFEAIVTITRVQDAQPDVNQPPLEELVVQGTLPAGITAAAFDRQTNSIRLTGQATVADYQQALRSIAYINRSENPTGTARILRFEATDTADRARFGRADRVIQLQSQNDLPTITVIGGPLGYADNTGQLLLDRTLAITDSDDTLLKGATVRVDTGLVAAEDTLDLTATTLPTGVTVTGRGTNTLTFTGEAPLADYQALLRTVFYSNANPNPTPGDRSIVFTVTDAKDGVSTADTLPIQVRNNNEPIVLLADQPLAYAEKQAAIAIDDQLTITDADAADQIERAVVSIEGDADTNDLLAFTASLPAGITLAEQQNNRLVFTGRADRATYQTLLRTVTYRNDNPQQPIRDILVQVFDGIENSPREVRRINVTANAAPELAPPTAAIAYGEGQTVNLVPDLTIRDADVGDLIESVTVTIDGFFSNEDIIAFTAPLPASIQTTGFNPTTRTLTFTGSATTTEYETLLRSLTYRNQSNDPTTTQRIISIWATDGTEESNIATRTITITTNAAPVVTIIDQVLNYTEGQGIVTLDNNLAIVDSDSAALTAATVLLRGYVADQDVIDFTPSLVPTGVTVQTTTTPEGHRSIAFTGSAPLGDYLALLRSITYSNTSSNPSTASRTIEVQVSDGVEIGTDSRTIQVEVRETVPILNASDTALVYREASGPQAIDDAITVTDDDTPNLVSAIVRIDPATFADGQDILEFNNQNTLGITGTYDAARGILSLTGTTTIANYQTALRSITFRNDSTDPRTGDRRILFTANDGTGNSREEQRIIQIEVINTPPVVTPSLGDTTYREDDPAVLVDANIGVSDADSPNLGSARVRITNVQTDDVLTFAPQGGITGSYTATTGELALTGIARREDYEAVLRSIRFRNTSQNPNATPRELEFSVSDTNNASNESATTRRRTITVIPVNDAPTVRITQTSQTYTDNAGAVVLTTGVTLADVDSLTLTGAIVSLEGFISGEDNLGFTNTATISGSFANGILTLTGTAPIAEYEAALRSITYTNLSQNPTLRNRTVRFTVNDGIDSSAPSDRFTLQIADSNTPPILTPTATPLPYTENAGAVAIDTTLTVTDSDSPNLTRATIAIQNYISSEELLSFTNQSGITGSFNATTGVLTLTGSASVANYQAALRSVAYTNTSNNPANLNRTIQFVVQDTINSSLPQVRQIQITSLNSPPFLATANAVLTYTEGTGIVAIDPSLIIQDADSPTLSGATVTLLGFVPQQDILSFTPRAGITGNLNPTTGVLSFTGNASIADYQAILRSVSYVNSSDRPETTNRTAQFTVQDSGNAVSNLASRVIQVVAVNDAPVVTASVQTTPFLRTVGSATIDSAFTITDSDSPILTGASIRLGLYIPGQDNLVFTNQNGITGALDGATGELVLTGSATVADYQTAIRSILYLNNSDSPDLRSRAVAISVLDDTVRSNVARLQIQFSQSTDLPILDLNGFGAGTDFSNTFTITGPAVPVISPEARLLNSTNTTLASAQISISNAFDAGEEELLVTTQGTPLTATYNSDRTILQLTGRAPVETYLQVLRSLRYINRSQAPDRTTRVILFTVNDGDRRSEVTQTTMQISQVNLRRGAATEDRSLETTPGTDLIDAFTSNDTVTSILANLQQNDIINGGTGIDTFRLIDGTGTATVNVENRTNQVRGILSGKTTISFFEDFDFTGFQGSVTMLGSNTEVDRLTGGEGNDILRGQAGRDWLTGNGGNDLLDGGLGDDTLIGGLGDDGYVIDSSGDVIIEAENAGFDTVESLLPSYTLPRHFEDLRLGGDALAGTGNATGNRILGNRLNNSIDGGLGNDFLVGEAGNDTLIGGIGNDELRGGIGNDRLRGGEGNDRLYGDRGRDSLAGGRGRDGFYFTSRRDGVDRITDFNPKDDTIFISRPGFSPSLRLGRIRRDQFTLGSRAQDSSDRFIYNRRTGALFFDADGSGGTRQIQLAQFTNRAALTRADIVIVG